MGNHTQSLSHRQTSPHVVRMDVCILYAANAWLFPEYFVALLFVSYHIPHHLEMRGSIGTVAVVYSSVSSALVT